MALTTVRPEGMGFNTGRRNLVINGAMQVAQRGTSVSYAHGWHDQSLMTVYTHQQHWFIAITLLTTRWQWFCKYWKDNNTAESAVAADERTAGSVRLIEGQNLQHLGLVHLQQNL